MQLIRKNVLLRSFVTMVFGLLLVIITASLIIFTDFRMMIQHNLVQVNLRFQDVFKHNVLIYCFYFVPILAHIHFIVSFIIIGGFIGAAVVSIGCTESIMLLWHLPLELFSFSIPLNLFKANVSRLQYFGFVLLGVILLLISAVIEVRGGRLI